ncbi:5'-3' exonuclease H3TH domain-containing protein [Ectothiorhodospira shaposhnikovii]|uniref:5'-3' exonuclease H3TH domain-containing protein n=1 Tax=Ectothiorhodospira shaposhnikovii TaxID=1054 RepID=UPI001EE8E262|nr:5'-3' exonuclease H3TH domain-containing protein [Ectothiorhodospira shaposhnikovii]MCG5512783.1 hypothetical protein [Ectothiorhodospira shaposhnikovii]
MSNILIVDGNNIGFAAQTGGAKLSVGGRDVRSIFGFLKTLRMLAQAHSDYYPIVLWDGKDNWRFKVYPEYKGNRNKDSKMAQAKEAWSEQKSDLQQALRLLGVAQCFPEQAEADDVAGLLVRKRAGRKAILVTGDKDWVQLVSNDVRWYDPIRDRWCFPSNFAEFTGYASARQFLDGKALTGDSSDNIKGVGGIGEKGAQELMMQYGSVEAFFHKVDAMGHAPASAVLKRFAANEVPPKSSVPMRDAYYRNLRLMNLIDNMEPIGLVTWDRSTPDIAGFKAFCEEFHFLSILSVLDQWQSVFSIEKRRAA